MTELERLEGQLDAIGRLVDEGDAALVRRAPRVSGWSVAQQLDHSLKVAMRSLGCVLEPDAAKIDRRGINLLGRLLLAFGRLPRGRGKAPKAVAGEERSSQELAAALAAVRARLAEVAARGELLARPDPIVPHPYFRCLNASQGLRMLAVHTDHHLRIGADIRRAAAAGGAA